MKWLAACAAVLAALGSVVILAPTSFHVPLDVAAGIEDARDDLYSKASNALGLPVLRPRFTDSVLPAMRSATLAGERPEASGERQAAEKAMYDWLYARRVSRAHVRYSGPRARAWEVTVELYLTSPPWTWQGTPRYARIAAAFGAVGGDAVLREMCVAAKECAAVLVSVFPNPHLKLECGPAVQAVLNAIDLPGLSPPACVEWFLWPRQ